MNALRSVARGSAPGTLHFEGSTINSPLPGSSAATSDGDSHNHKHSHTQGPRPPRNSHNIRDLAEMRHARESCETSDTAGHVGIPIEFGRGFLSDAYPDVSSCISQLACITAGVDRPERSTGVVGGVIGRRGGGGGCLILRRRLPASAPFECVAGNEQHAPSSSGLRRSVSREAQLPSASGKASRRSLP